LDLKLAIFTVNGANELRVP